MASADRLFWLQALTPLHLGAGKGEGYIDLPLLREKVTNFPFVPGSAVKGVFADSHGATDDARSSNAVLQAAFGRAGDDTANAGALVFTDARLICLPVRSLYGTFAWCTSPFILGRLRRDLDAAGFEGWPDAPDSITVAHVPASEKDPKLPHTRLSGGSGAAAMKIFLEDLDLSCRACAKAAQWASHIADALFAAPAEASWRTQFRERFVVVPDDVFSFLAETGTEVQPHVRIDPDFKRVASGALWYEESLPAESILCGLLWCDAVRSKGPVTRENVLGLCQDSSLQIGGKATTGKGRVRLRFQSPGGQP